MRALRWSLRLDRAAIRRNGKALRRIWNRSAFTLGPDDRVVKMYLHSAVLFGRGTSQEAKLAIDAYAVGHSGVDTGAVWEEISRLERDVEILSRFETQEDLGRSVYQQEEVLAILERIERHYQGIAIWVEGRFRITVTS